LFQQMLGMQMFPELHSSTLLSWSVFLDFSFMTHELKHCVPQTIGYIHISMIP
jgi:hypothetical protein